jgi:protein SCO1/2
VEGPRQTDLFPDVQLTDQDGNQHLFRSDLAVGKVLCLAMFYTRCDGSCPGTLSKMLKLRRSLTKEFGRDNLHFVCLTLDPLHDQPEILHRYVASLGIENDDELAPIFFCTGTPENLYTLRRSLGMYDPDPAIDADIRQHAAKILFGNDLLNRWSGMPAGLPFEDLYETALRIAGTSERQKFSTRLAIDGRK